MNMGSKNRKKYVHTRRYKTRRKYEDVVIEDSKKFERRQNAKQEDRLRIIMDMKKAGDKAGLENQLRLMNKRLNQRFRELEKKIGDPKKLKNLTAYEFAQNKTGMEKPRYTESLSKIGKKSIDEIYEELLDRNMKLSSKTSSLEGIKYLPTNRSRGAIEGIQEQLHISLDDTDMFRQFLEEHVNDMLDNNLSSSVIFEFYENALKKEKSIDDIKAIWEMYKDRAGDKPIDTAGLVKWLGYDENN